jgi:hypothetical protein
MDSEREISVDMAEDLRADRGVHRRIGEYRGDERRLVIIHHDPGEIKNDVQAYSPMSI